MSKKSNKKHILTRYGIIIGFIMIIAIGVVYKLVDTTIISADEWNRKANKELSRSDTILPVRGNILAADGSILAANLLHYTVRIDFRCERFMEDKYRSALDTIADSMAYYFPIRTAKQWKKHLAAPLDKPKDERPRAYRLIGNINSADYRRLRTFPFFSIKNRNRNGITVEEKMRRVNPYGDMARRSIGGVGATVQSREVHGISGLEKALDSLLYGKNGLSKKVPLTKGIEDWTDIPAVPGLNITTTIDINIQDIVENELNDMLKYCNADWGVAVLMDVATGDIKAISNLEKNPRANNYIEGMNRAVLGFEPGSVVKTISMLIALEDGIVNSINEVIPTGTKYPYAGGKSITDTHPASALTVKGVMERSSNIGMTKIMTRRYDYHPGGFYSRLKEIGILEPMHTGIAGERIPRIDSVPSTRGGRIAMSRQCYGYATEIPPLYTLSVYNAIANKGKYVRPRLVSRLTGEKFDSVLPVTYIRESICSEVNASKLKAMLASVVTGKHGTAKRLENEYVNLVGKTGTCYMIEGGKYNTKKKRLSFCGFFPAENPKYSCFVLTCNPKHKALTAAATSGEAFKNIALKLFSRGMLNNRSDYRAEPVKSDHPVLYATADAQKAAKIGNIITSGGVYSTIKQQKEPAGGVPSVVGLGLRDAIAVLEKNGYNVRFKGSGYVATQTPAAGTKSATGSKVTLLLEE